MLPEVMHRLWDLYEAGYRPEEVARHIGWSRTGVADQIRFYGGMRPRWGRSLKGRSLTFEERENIMLWRAEKVGIREIGRRLNRSASTISRELQRNSSWGGKYRATTGQSRAFARSRRPKEAKLATAGPLRDRVQNDLAKKYSPVQISGRLRVEFPERPEMQVSQETIYQSVYLLSRGGLKRELVTQLRTGRARRKSRREPEQRRGKIRDMVMITDRPADVEDRAIPGDWEGDLIVGTDNKSAIGTIVERSTGYLMLLHLPAGMPRVEAVRDGLIDKMGALPDVLRRSLTWDQGTEMHRHKDVSIAIDLAIYFCDPHSPWQRGTNENTNGLLRQYFPKSTDLAVYSQEDLDYVEWEMNDRPRQRLGFLTPNEKIEQLLLQ